MSLTRKNRIRIIYIKAANSANRTINVAVEAVGRSLTALNDKTAGAIDRRQDKAFAIRKVELSRIYEESYAREALIKAELRALPKATAAARKALFASTQT